MKQMNRRQFLNKSIRSAASVPLGVAALSLAPRRALGANERLNIALIGCGGRGRYVARGIRELGAEISFLCDLHEGRLAEAAKRSPTFQGFINISTSSVYGIDATGDETTEPKPTSYYGVTKLAAEQLVLAYARDEGFPACSLRLFSVYGPRERPEKLYPKLIRCILEDREFPLYEGSQDHVRSYTYVDDAIDGLVAALERIAGEAAQPLDKLR